MTGFVKIHRDILGKPVADNNNCYVLFTKIVMLACYKPEIVTHKGKSIAVQRGQYLCSIRRLAIETNLSIKQTRVALTKCIENNSLQTNIEPHTKLTLITVCNYAKYQSIAERIGRAGRQNDCLNAKSKMQRKECAPAVKAYWRRKIIKPP